MPPQGLKARFKHEMIEYALNVAYLTLVFGAFTWYRRLLLAAHDIAYTHYGVAFIEAFVLGKVVMIGGLLRLGRGLERLPLIWPTLYKAAVFCLFVALFKVVEHGVRGMVGGEGFAAGAAEITRKGLHELMANVLVVFVALLPFFAVKELQRTLGREVLWGLFFRRAGTREAPRSSR